MQISLRRMKNGRWKWQTLAGNGEVGGGIYDPQLPDYATPTEAAEAASKWCDTHKKG